MPVAMMQVWRMRVLVLEALMPVLMQMWFTDLCAFVRVQVVLVMRVLVAVAQRFMAVPVTVLFAAQ